MRKNDHRSFLGSIPGWFEDIHHQVLVGSAVLKNVRGVYCRRIAINHVSCFVEGRKYPQLVTAWLCYCK